jgi:hypothetical protein
MEKCKGYQRRQSLSEKEVKDAPEEGIAEDSTEAASLLLFRQE